MMAEVLLHGHYCSGCKRWWGCVCPKPSQDKECTVCVYDRASHGVGKALMGGEIAAFMATHTTNTDTSSRAG